MTMRPPSLVNGPHFPICPMTWAKDDWPTWEDQDCCHCVGSAAAVLEREAYQRREEEKKGNAKAAREAWLAQGSISMLDVMLWMRDLDQARARKDYAEADRIRLRLQSYGVRVQSEKHRSLALVCLGHRVRDYDGWEFSPEEAP